MLDGKLFLLFFGSFRLYDETRILPSRFLFQVQQRTKQQRNQRLSCAPKHGNSSQPPLENLTVTEEVAAYKRFSEEQSNTRRKLALAAQGNERDSQMLSDQPPSQNGLHHAPLPLPSRRPVNMVYENYFWKPLGTQGGRNATITSTGKPVVEGPKYSRNPKELLKTKSYSFSSTSSSNGTSDVSATNRRPLPSSRASRSATIM